MSQEKQPRSATEKFNARIREARQRLPSRPWQASDLDTLLDRFRLDNNEKNTDTHDHWVARHINRQTRLDKPGMYDLAMELIKETAQYARVGGQIFTYRSDAPPDPDSEGRIILDQRSYDILRECVQFKLNRLKDPKSEGPPEQRRR
jgi:hypothetical protein